MRGEQSWVEKGGRNENVGTVGGGGESGNSREKFGRRTGRGFPVHGKIGMATGMIGEVER